MVRRVWIPGCCIAGLLLAAPAGADVLEEIGGLVARYGADSLRGSLNSGDPVRTWPDISGNGHDLADDENGAPAIFQDQQVQGLPAVRVHKANSHSVASPFALGDHTILVVYAADRPKRALFRSDQDLSVGLLLGDPQGRIVLQVDGSSPGAVMPYTPAAEPNHEFSLAVLGRESGKLRGFVDGVDVSTDQEYTPPIRVGKWFHLRHTAYVQSDGEGLRLAEAAFYDRYLTADERNRAITFLAGKYGIESRAPAPEPASVAASAASATGTAAGASAGELVRYAILAQLSTSTEVDVNSGLVAIPWTVPLELDPSFRHDSSAERNSRLTLMQDEARVRLYVSLPLTAEAEGANVRVLFRVNGTKFLPGESRSGTIGGSDGKRKAAVQAEVVTRLTGGDYVEVLAMGIGGPGKVTVDGGAAIFLAELK